MKRMFKIMAWIIVLMTLVAGSYNPPSRNKDVVISANGTYTNTTVDTIYTDMQVGIDALSFYPIFADTADIGLVTVRRIVGNAWTPIRAGDTLTTGDSLTSGGRLYNIPLTPIPAKYAVIVNYSNDGGWVAGVSTPYVTYAWVRKFNY